MSVDPILNQEADPECIQQFLSNQEDGVLEPVADSPVEDILEVLGDNFTPNQTNEPSESHWDTTPRASTIRFFGGMAEEEWRRRGLFGDNEPEGPGENKGNVNDDVEQEVTFRFTIFDSTVDVTMKNIPPSALPHFHGMSTEDLDSFLFELYILCRSYNYVNDAQKLQLFPATLKDSALWWFMGLGEHTIRSWDEMKTTFLRKYQEYYRSKDSRNDIFKMQQQEEENLEDYVERFVYNLQKSRHNSLNPNAIRTIFLKGTLEDYIDMLNLMETGDVS
jgi:hypothetical protein